MRFLVAAIAIIAAPISGFAQLASEFATLACKPSQHDSPGVIVEKEGHDWVLSLPTAEAKKSILRSAAPISNAQWASEAGYIAYFTANSKYPKQSGWVLLRLADGKSVQIAEAQLPPISACITPDGKKLAYVTQFLAAVQLDLAPAFERFRYWDDPAPKDHVLVPAPSGG